VLPPGAWLLARAGKLQGFVINGGAFQQIHVFCIIWKQ
jgi:hypothetical protein